MNAKELIEILEATSYNMGVPLDEMEVIFRDKESWEYRINEYSHGGSRKKIILAATEGPTWMV